MLGCGGEETGYGVKGSTLKDAMVPYLHGLHGKTLESVRCLPPDPSCIPMHLPHRWH